jgi:ferredoxin-NADP reductase
MDDQAPIMVTVAAVTRETETVNLYTLARDGGAPLPAFTAGAHIDVVIKPDMVRQYSLLNSQADPSHYRIAVLREPGGGSAFLHDEVRAGSALQISAPRNHFALVEDAAHSVLIAAGIGITPLWSMAQRLSALGRSWELHYGARSRAEAALLRELEACGGRVHLHFSREAGGSRLPLAQIAAAAEPGAHVYACGPRAMLAAFEALPIAATRHVEHFSPIHEAAHEGGFTIVLARSGRRIAVPAGATILDTLKASNIAAAYSCAEGICGRCETAVLGGIPDHRDSILSEAERAAGKTMMICCSGARTDELVLDL